MIEFEDWHQELASMGAGHAATALAKLFDCTVPVEPARCFRLEVRQLPESMIYPQEWASAIFTDFTGAVRGQAGLMLTQGVVHQLIVRLAHEDPAAGLSARARSALEELGNIALSAAAGALGGTQGGVVLPSVPRLSFDMHEALLPREPGSPRERMPAFLAETELVEREGPLRVRFIWIPAGPAAAGLPGEWT